MVPNVGQYIQSLGANPAGGAVAAQGGVDPNLILRAAMSQNPAVPGGIPGYSLGALAQGPVVPTPGPPAGFTPTPVPPTGAGSPPPMPSPPPAPGPQPVGQQIPGAYTGVPGQAGLPVPNQPGATTPVQNPVTGAPLNQFQGGAPGSDFVDPTTGLRFVVNADGSIVPVQGGLYNPGYEG